MNERAQSNSYSWHNKANVSRVGGMAFGTPTAMINAVR